MQKIEEFVDERQKSWCIHCTRSLADIEANEDHVPTKGFLLKPLPHNLPTVTICTECNISFSLDEQYAITFLSCVLAGSTDPDAQSNASAARALAGSLALRAQIGRSRIDYMAEAGNSRVVRNPDMARFERVVLKNARGHAYFEHGKPMLEPGLTSEVWPLEFMTVEERREFEGLSLALSFAPWPEVGSRMTTRLASGEDMAGPWIIVQEGIYRYSVKQESGLRVRSVLSEYVGTEVLWEH